MILRMRGPHSGSRVPMLRLTAILLAVVLATAGWVRVAQDGNSAGQIVVAEFNSASPLVEGSDVKVHGVQVGKVSAIQLDPKTNKAQVSMKLDAPALPVHSDAAAEIRAVSLLGERYVDLKRGSAAAPVLPGGARLPSRQTSQNTGLDQVLNVFDKPTGESLTQLVGTLGQGLDGNGEKAAAAVDALEPAMRDTDGLARVLSSQNRLLTSLVDKLEPVAGELGTDNGQTLDNVVQSTTTVTATTAERQQKMRQTLGQLPATLSDAQRVLGTLTGTAQQTAPTLKAIRPTTDDLSAISDEINRFSDSADPALASAEPVLDKGQELLNEARPVADQLRMAGPALRSDSASARPIVAQLADNFGNVLNFVRYWALTTNGYDGISHYFRGHVSFDPSVVQHVTGSGSNIPPLNPPPPGGPQQPQTPAPLPPGGGLLPPLDGKGPPGGLLAPGRTPDGSATGLNQKQESNALEFLLGGGQ